MFKPFTMLALLLSLVLVACPEPQKPAIASFTATPDSLPFTGGTSKLKWQVEGADTISIDNGVGVVTGTSKDINLTATTTFTLTATNAQGSSTQSVTVTVLEKPKITSFTATPNSLPLGGGSSKLEWQVSSADSVSIDKGVGVVTGTSKDINVTTTTTFTITATNGQGSTTQTTTVNVAQKPTIVSFKAVPSELPLGGGTSKLEWDVMGADTISIDNGVGVVTGTSKDVTVTDTKTFTLTATNAQGSTTQTATITVTQKPIIASFTATPSSLPFTGGSSKLEWQVSGADSISIDNGVGVVTGTSADVNLTITKTFTLSATNSNGTSTKTLTVTVLQKPVIASFTATPNSLPIGGGSSKLEWQVSGADSVSIDNGVGVVTGTSKDVTVDATKTFTITATNGQGSVTQTATVTVAEPVALTNISGSITPWTRGARLVQAGVSGTSAQNFLFGNMDATGAFNLPLVAPPSASLTTPNFGPNCTTIVANPPNPLFAGFSQLSVVTSGGVASGTLSQSNFSSPTFTGPPQTGSKFMQYFYSNQNGTLKGTCTNSTANSSGKVTIDWNFAKGWNAFLIEYVNTTDIRTITVQPSEIPADVTWKFVAAYGGSITITNPITSLELGKSVTLQATAVENDGTPITNPDFVWTSSDPKSIEVTPGGVATAKAVNSYGTTITVAIKNYSMNSTNINVSTYGFEAVGGTFNLEDASLGTAVRMRYQGAPGTSLSSLNYTITGPSGWNNNQPFNGSLSLTTNSFGLLSEIPAVNGSYQIQTDTGSTLTFTVDTTKKLPPVTNFKISPYQYNSSQYSLSWDNIPGFVFTPYETNSRIELNIKDQTTGQFVVSNERMTYSPWIIAASTLDSTHTYAVYLTATQGLQTGEVTASRATAILDFHPELSQLSATGGAKNGGYTMTINGFNFDINTSVFFGSVESTSKTLQGTNSMQVIVPAGTPGVVDIKLSNTRGASTISSLSKFTYYDIQEFDVASSSKLLASSNGEVYFIEENSSLTPPVSLAKITSAGTITRVGLTNVALSSVRDTTVDAAGNVWIALDSKVLRVSPSGGITEVALPTGVSAQMIAVGSDGNLWIARADSSNITRMQTDGSNPATFALTGGGIGFSTSFSSNNEMLLGPDGNIWFTNSSGYGKVTPSGSVTLISNYGMTGMIFNDGAFWIASQYSGIITRVDINGIYTTYANSCSGNRIGRGSDNAFWCGGNGGFYGFNDILVRTTLTGTVGTTGNVILSSATNGALATDLIADSNGKIWYLRGNKIGVISP